MSPNKLLIPLGLIIGVCSQAQSATVYPDFGSVVQGSVYGSDCSSLSGCFLNLSQSTSVTGSTSGVNSSASALANLAQGFVSATAWASTSNDFNGSQSHALIWNTVTFSGAKTGDVATLTLSGNATVSAALPVTGDTARANAAAILIDENLYPYGVGYFLAGNASTPESGAYTLQDQAQITNGDPYLMLVYVDAYSGLNGGPFPGGSASINDPFRLDVPVGVTVNYAFQPIAAVPEPSTWAMLLFGLVSIGSMGYRQSLKKNAATVVAS